MLKALINLLREYIIKDEMKRKKSFIGVRPAAYGKFKKGGV